MLIRSQDKKRIINFSDTDCVEIEPNFYDGEKYYINTNFPEREIAEYSTEEKAIKVLDMIEAAYIEIAYAKYVKDEGFASVTFQMPQDSEV